MQTVKPNKHSSITHSNQLSSSVLAGGRSSDDGGALQPNKHSSISTVSKGGVLQNSIINAGSGAGSGTSSSKIFEARNSLDRSDVGSLLGGLRLSVGKRDDRNEGGSNLRWGVNVTSIAHRDNLTTRLLSNSNVTSALSQNMESSLEAINRAKAMIIGSIAQGIQPQEEEKPADDEDDDEYHPDFVRRNTEVPVGINHLGAKAMFDESAGGKAFGKQNTLDAGEALKKTHKKASFSMEVSPYDAEAEPRPQRKGLHQKLNAKDSLAMAHRREAKDHHETSVTSRDSHGGHDSSQRESLTTASTSMQLAAQATEALIHPHVKKRRFSDELPEQLRTPQAHDRMLHKVPIFQGCDSDFMSALVSNCKKKTLSAGETMALDPFTLTVVCSGTVHVEMQRQLVEVLTEGQAIGESGMLGAPNNPLLTLRVPMTHGKHLSFAKVCHINTKIFKAALSTHPRERSRFTDLTFSVLYKADPFKTIPFVDVLKGRDWVNTVLLRCAYRRILSPQQMIAKEGDETPQGLVMVRSGTVILSIGSCEIKRVTTGQTFGETLLFGVSSKWSVTAICENVCDILIMNRMTFSRQIEDVKPVQMHEVQRLLGLNHGKHNESAIHYLETSSVLHISPVFRGCSHAFIEALNRCLEERVYMPGQTIVESGSEEDSLYYINNGVAEEDGSMLADTRRSSMQGRESVALKTKTTLEKGSVFGVQQFLKLKPKHLTTLQAKTLCPVQLLHHKVFLLVLDEFPKEPAAPDIQKFLEEEIENRELDLSTLDNGVSQTVIDLPLLRDTANGFIGCVWDGFQRRIHPPGQKIVREGYDIEELFVVNRGVATVSIGGHMIRKLEKGGYFGDVAILGERPRRATATLTCDVATESWVLHCSHFQHVLEDFPKEKERFGNAAMLMQPTILSDAGVRARSNAELRNRRCLSKAEKSEQRQMSHLDFFGGCSESFLEEVQRGMEERLYVEGERIMTEGDDANCMYILHRGLCEVLVGGHRFSELTEGAVFGDLCVLGLTTCRDVTVVAHGFCTVHVLHKNVFDHSLEHNPSQRDHFERISLARLDGNSTDTFSLPDTPFFSECDLRFLEILEGHLHTILYPADSVILQEGSEADVLNILSLGDAIMEVGGVEQGTLGPGDTFGEALVLGLTKKADYAVRAKALCVTRRINAEFLMKTLQGFTKDAKMLVEEATTRMNISLPEPAMSPIFHGVNQRFTEKLAATLDWHTFLAGVLITRQGTAGHAMYFVLFGEVVIEYDGQVVAGMPMGPGDSWGELNLLGVDKKNRQSTRARFVCHLRSLTAESFDKLLVAFPGERIRFEQLAFRMKSEEVEREDAMKSQVQTVKVQKRMDGAFKRHVSVNTQERQHHHNEDANQNRSTLTSPQDLFKKSSMGKARASESKGFNRRHAMSVANISDDEASKSNAGAFSALRIAGESSSKKDEGQGLLKSLKGCQKISRYETIRRNAVLRGKVLRLARQGVYLDDELRGMQRLNDEELEDLETIGVLPDQTPATAQRTQAARDLQAMRPTPPSMEQAVQRTFAALIGRSLRKMPKL